MMTFLASDHGSVGLTGSLGGHTRNENAVLGSKSQVLLW